MKKVNETKPRIKRVKCIKCLNKEDIYFKKTDLVQCSKCGGWIEQ